MCKFHTSSKGFFVVRKRSIDCFIRLQQKTFKLRTKSKNINKTNFNTNTKIR